MTVGDGDSRARSVMKAGSWRVLGTLVTAALAWAFTRRLDIAVALGGFEGLSKTLLFYLHERAWNRVPLRRRDVAPAVIWFTGLSGSGKSTIAEHVVRALEGRGVRCEYLDGDAIRSILPGTGFTREERDAHIRRVGYLASRLEEHGVFVVASLVSPYLQSREYVRKLCRNYIEIYVATPLEECERRDVKGLYARARRGEIRNFSGIDDPYEPPDNPDLVLDTRHLSPADAAAAVLDRVRANA